MSGCLAGQTTSIAQLLAGYVDFSVAGFPMAVARSKHLGVVRNPLENEPDHVLIFGNKTDATRRWLAKQSSWVAAPPTLICKKPGGCDCVPRNVPTPAMNQTGLTPPIPELQAKDGVVRSMILWLCSLFIRR